MSEKEEEKLIELLEDKIREADVYFREDEDITEEAVDGYINGLEMAKTIIKEHEYLDIDTDNEEKDYYDGEYDKVCKIDIENKNDLYDLFVDFFRIIQDHDYTDEEISLSVNNDDIREYLLYIQEETQKAIGLEKINMIKDRKDINFNK